MRSRKTTVAGAIGALGLILVGLSRGLAGPEDPAGAEGGPELPIPAETIGLALAALGSLAAGVFARDDNVTSEGGRAPRRRRSSLEPGDTEETVDGDLEPFLRENGISAVPPDPAEEETPDGA